MTASHAAQYRIPADWQQFQRLSVAVASAHFGLDFQVYGRNGQWQGGIDAYAYTQEGRLIAIQSKSKDEGYGSVLTPADVTRAVEKAREFKFEIDVLVILTSSPDDIKLCDRALEITQVHLAKGEFAVEVWGWQTIEGMIREHESIQQSFYPLVSAKTSSWQWFVRTSVLCGLIVFAGYTANEYMTYQAAKTRIQGDTGIGVKRFVQQSDQLREAYANCQSEMDKSLFLSSFEFDHYCTTPIDNQLLAMQSSLQELVLDIDSDVFEKMSSVMGILESYQLQGRQAGAMTGLYEDFYRKALLKFCRNQSEHFLTDELKQRLQMSATQQLEFYHALSNFIYPSLSAMKAHVIASALQMRGHKVAPTVLAEANQLNKLLSERRAYHLKDVAYPFTLSAVKMMSSPYAGMMDKSGGSSDVEAMREREVLIGGGLSSFLGHPKEARQIVECGGMKPEFIPALKKMELEITGRTFGTGDQSTLPN